MRTANAELGALNTMKLSDKLDGWINYLESIDTPLEEPSVARDYSEAWEKLQKRRTLLKSLERIAIFMIFLPVIPIILKIEPAFTQTAYPIWFFLFISTLLVTKVSLSFRCPRCGKVFLHAKATDQELNNRKTKCMYCGLLIGEKKVNEELKKS
jgi:DNA-directed RNA polymerase subunit RPC12/RpoP